MIPERNFRKLTCGVTLEQPPFGFQMKVMIFVLLFSYNMFVCKNCITHVIILSYLLGFSFSLT